MIKSRKDILPLLVEYLNTQYEYTYQFWISDINTWSGKRQAMYSNGIVLGKFREKDVETIRVLNIGVEEGTEKITQFEMQGLLFLYYAFDNWKHERKHPYCDEHE